MAEITINGVKYTNVPNKKAGTKFAASLTQSNIGASQAVQDYVNSSYFYPLVNAIDINWNGVEIDENSYINSTSDLITYIATKGSNVDLTSYATVNYVDQKIEDVVGGAPETLDTLKELADALADEASLAYVTQALDGKADKSSLDDYATVAYVTTELDKKADLSDIPSAPDLTPYATVSYVTEELDKKVDISDMPVVPDMTNYVTYTDANSYYLKLNGSNQVVNGNVRFNSNGVEFGTNNQHIFWINSSFGKYGDMYDMYGVMIGPYTDDKAMAFTTRFDSNKKHKFVFPYGKYVKNWLGNVDGTISYIPLAFTIDNSTYIKPNVAGVVNLSSIISGGGGDMSDYVTYTQANSYYAGKNEIPDMTNYATVSYVTEELDKKADISDIPVVPDMTNYVTYTDANSYYVKTTGNQNILGVKTFVGNKTVEFKQSNAADKLGFTCFNNTGYDIGGLEYRPNTINGKGLLSLQHFVSTSSISTIAQSYIGIRQTQGNNKYHLVAPIPADVATIETITSSNYKNFFMPLVFKNGSNKVYTDCTGLVDMASLMPDLDDYATVSYVTTELVNKADASDIPDMTNYVDVTSYNALYAEVQHLAYLINYYHPSSPDPSPTPTQADGYWTDGQAMYTSSFDISTQDLSPSLTFVGTPDNNSWTFTDSQVSGITVYSTGSIDIDTSAVSEGTYYVTASYPGDGSYSSNSITLTITVTGSSLNYPTGYWTCDGIDWGTDGQGDTGWTLGEASRTFTFSGNPASGWTFDYPTGTGITTDTTTGEITIDASVMSVEGTYTFTASYAGDSEYDSATKTLTITIESSQS